MRIDITESFQHLSQAPIVEAVIGIRALASRAMEETQVKAYVESELAGYSYLDSQKEFRQTFRIGTAEHEFHELGWNGLRVQSFDKKHIGRFGREGFTFSRLHPYETWDRFFEESMGLWQHYMSVAAPQEVQRVGLRFINRIEVPTQILRVDDYIDPGPSLPRGLSGLVRDSFLYQDRLVVPESPYGVSIVRTIQPPNTDKEPSGIILDVDVFTTEEFSVDDARLEQRLPEMRWLKNKVFFGTITNKTLEMLR